MPPSADAIAGCLLGCAVGDSLGLPYEGLSRRRGIRLLGQPTRQRFLFGRGMVSDDTEQTCMIAQALCRYPDDPARFARDFARRLCWWLAGLPAGIGLATLKATLKLWIGFSPSRSGVFSAGNGPAMRSAILGAAIDNTTALAAFVRASTLVTHTDPKAFQGALAVALAARAARRGEDATFPNDLRIILGSDIDPEFAGLLDTLATSLASSEPTAEFARKLKGGERGVSGYVLRTVPVVLHAWLSSPRDFRRAVTEVIRCGGDTDTTAAIVGAIVGSGTGPDGIPAEWLGKLREWPRSVGWMRQLGQAVAGRPMAPPRVLPLVGLARNAVFLGAVLVHAARRFLPPN